MLNSRADDDSELLLSRLAAGDETVREPLLNRYRDRLNQMVRLRMDDRLQARFDPSDVVQEALLIADQRLKSLAEISSKVSGETSPNQKDSSASNQCAASQEATVQGFQLYPLLRKITWEQFIKFREKHLLAAKRSVRREQLEAPQLNDDSLCLLAERVTSGERSPSQLIIQRERISQVKNALSLMHQRDREVIELKYLEQLSNHEIAAVLDITSQAVRTRHFRAIQRLHSALNPNADE